MEEKNQPTSSLQDIKDIRQIMERSSRFISLSGLSGIAAGVCALAGAFIAYGLIDKYYGSYNSSSFFSGDDFSRLKIKLTMLGAGVFAVAFITSFYLISLLRLRLPLLTLYEQLRSQRQWLF